MNQSIITGLLVFAVAIVMTMVGKGGGNFYVVILTLAQTPMHEAATTGQFILFAASVAALIVFQKNKSVSWTLAFIIGASTAVAALGGGYFSHLFSGFTLKIIFALMLIAAGVAMVLPVAGKKNFKGRQPFGVLRIKSGNETYGVNIWIVLPVTALTGFGAGMVGVSGGSFLVPLMVLACGVSVHMAVGTASIMLAMTAFMGFVGHAVQGDFHPASAVPLAVVTIIGGLLGGKFALRANPKHLKMIFAYTNWAAAVFMTVNAFLTRQGI